MRKLRFLLFVLSALVFLLAVSSISCFASPVDFTPVEYDLAGAPIHPVDANPVMNLGLDEEEISSGGMTITDTIYSWYSQENTWSRQYFFGPLSVGEDNVSHITNIGLYSSYYDSVNYKLMRELILRPESGNELLSKNANGSITINNISSSLSIQNPQTQAVLRNYLPHWDKYSSFYAIIYYTDSLYDYIYPTANEIGQLTVSSRYNPSDQISITVNFEMLKKPVARILIATQYNTMNYFSCPASDLNSDTYVQNFYFGLKNCYVTSEINNKDTGLLSGLLAWVKSIYESVKSIPEKIQSIFSAIAELPQKIWTFISDGLKNLFVPSETKIEEFKTNFENLFAERFGALYESGQYITSFFENLAENDTKTTIEIPLVSVPLAGVDYNFGGYTVEIVPVKFKFLLDILKGVLDIIVTVAFINAMKKRFEGILGGENTSA